MKASALEFRLRMWIQIVIVFLGFWAPWLGPLDWSRRISTLAWLAMEISRIGIASFAVATPVVIVAGGLAAAIGMILRVWGAAYLGYGTVHHEEMQGGAVIAAGPFRLMRNPLYVGGWFMMLAFCLLMTPSGALFTMVLETPDPGRRGVPYRKTRRALQGISACGAATCAAVAQQSSRRGSAPALAHRRTH